MAYNLRQGYAGINWNSHAEERWAATADNLGLSWRYEPARLERWLIDFLLFTSETATGIPVEVKGGYRSDSAIRDAAMLWAKQKRFRARRFWCLFLGDIPLQKGGGYRCIGHWLSADGFTRIAGVARCPKCQASMLTIVDAWRPCHRCRTPYFDNLKGEPILEDAFKRAQNATQWHPALPTQPVQLALPLRSPPPTCTAAARQGYSRFWPPLPFAARQADRDTSLSWDDERDAVAANS